MMDLLRWRTTHNMLAIFKHRLHTVQRPRNWGTWKAEFWRIALSVSRIVVGEMTGIGIKPWVWCSCFTTNTFNTSNIFIKITRIFIATSETDTFFLPPEKGKGNSYSLTLYYGKLKENNNYTYAHTNINKIPEYLRI